jgi:serine/threonine protein phosphatase PrpC
VGVCPACGAAVGDADLFCEACGQDLAGGTVVGVTPSAAGRWVTSSDPVIACAGCGGTSFGVEGYCDNCGQRRARAKDRTELDLGTIAAVTDRGLRHLRNEDAVALGRLADTMIAIVCDGVSTSTRPDEASNGAVDAAAPTIVGALTRKLSPAEAIAAATKAAQAAATLAAGPEPGPNPPASTFVCAVVALDAVTVGWIGDSRAYWLPDSGGQPACLTVDDSVASQAAVQGVPVPDGMPVGALVRWLGADATDTVPHVRCYTPTGPGRVLVCSDGLFKYRPEPADLAAATPRLRPLETVRALVRLALDAGGADNISAAVLPYPPVPEEQR